MAQVVSPELSAMLEKVWTAGDRLAAAVMVDYVQERIGDEKVMTATAKYADSDDYVRVMFQHLSDGDFVAEVLDSAVALYRIKRFAPDRFAGEFPEWIDKQFDLLHHILSK